MRVNIKMLLYITTCNILNFSQSLYGIYTCVGMYGIYYCVGMYEFVWNIYLCMYEWQ